MRKIAPASAGVLVAERQQTSVYEFVNGGLFFKKTSQEKEYYDFQQEQSSFMAAFFTQIFGSFYFIASRVGFMIYFPSVFSSFSAVFAVLIFVVLGWTLVYLKHMNKNYNHQSVAILENIWYFVTNVSVALSVFAKAYNGQCVMDNNHANNFIERFGCSTTMHEAHEGYMIISLILPTILQIMMKGIVWENQIFTLACCIFVNGFTIFHYEMTYSYPLYIMFAPFSVITLYFFHVQQLELFFSHCKSNQLIKENKSLARQDHVNEMRHLIGNVAHDMKTVSVSVLYVSLCVNVNVTWLI